ncbi:DUF6101 family protein [Roseibium polysiphoniae]|uniref:Uncharacterized protein n=1 Tax=Roseibium polysiphoniae TaxID=2571221 RepID=A0ABR9CEG3_9HYPH|nr:DUF6101 family protein [Roseibium polysiphoniae]MBD8878033.1 hypothetical protein [Roseibium polysiphoniae]
MRRQTAVDRAMEAGAGAIAVPDPGQLPAVFETRLFDVAVADETNPVEVKLDTQNVSISRWRDGGLKSLIAPVHTYSGVMVQIEASDVRGAVAARLILKHPDPQFCVILIETDKPEQLATSWPSWSAALNLPMLVCDTGGAVKPIEAFSARPCGTPAPRRKYPLLTGRRPRFLVRRRIGQTGAQFKVYKGEREIIARD